MTERNYAAAQRQDQLSGIFGHDSSSNTRSASFPGISLDSELSHDSQPLPCHQHFKSSDYASGSYITDTFPLNPSTTITNAAAPHTPSMPSSNPSIFQPPANAFMFQSNLPSPYTMNSHLMPTEGRGANAFNLKCKNASSPSDVASLPSNACAVGHMPANFTPASSSLHSGSLVGGGRPSAPLHISGSGRLNAISAMTHVRSPNGDTTQVTVKVVRSGVGGGGSLSTLLQKSASQSSTFPTTVAPGETVSGNNPIHLSTPSPLHQMHHIPIVPSSRGAPNGHELSGYFSTDDDLDFSIFGADLIAVKAILS